MDGLWITWGEQEGGGLSTRYSQDIHGLETGYSRGFVLGFFFKEDLGGDSVFA